MEIRNVRKRRYLFFFSDEYEPLLNEDGTVKYLRPHEDRYLVKQLRRGDFSPELLICGLKHVKRQKLSWQTLFMPVKRNITVAVHDWLSDAVNNSLTLASAASKSKSFTSSTGEWEAMLQFGVLDVCRLFVSIKFRLYVDFAGKPYKVRVIFG